MNNQKVGNLIAVLRKKKLMTQQTLATKLGVTNKAISKWETGEGYPEITIIPALSKELGITADELLAGKLNRDMPPSNGDPIVTTLLYKNRINATISFSITFFGIIIFSLFSFVWSNLILVGYALFITLITVSFIIINISFQKSINNINNIIYIKKIKNSFVLNNSILILILTLSFSLLIFHFIESNIFGIYILFIISSLFIAVIIIFILRNKIKRLYS